MQTAQSLHPRLFVALTHMVGALVIALLAGVFYFAAHQPLRDQQLADELRSHHLRKILANSIEVRRQHVQLQKEIDVLMSRIGRSRDLTPDQSKESEFLAAASSIAAEQGLEIVDYRRGKVRRLLKHAELDITLNTEGSHRSICAFLAAMEATPRAKQIKQLEIESSDAADRYPMEVSYTIYFGLESGPTSRSTASL